MSQRRGPHPALRRKCLLRRPRHRHIPLHQRLPLLPRHRRRHPRPPDYPPDQKVPILPHPRSPQCPPRVTRPPSLPVSSLGDPPGTSLGPRGRLTHASQRRRGPRPVVRDRPIRERPRPHSLSNLEGGTRQEAAAGPAPQSPRYRRWTGAMLRARACAGRTAARGRMRLRQLNRSPGLQLPWGCPMGMLGARARQRRP